MVVNVFCQLVSLIHENEAWDEFVTKSTPVNYTLAPVRDSSSFSSPTYKTLRELERSWTRDEGVNRELLRNHGPSMCADLVKVSICHSIHIHGNTHLDFIGIVA